MATDAFWTAYYRSARVDCTHGRPRADVSISVTCDFLCHQLSDNFEFNFRQLTKSRRRCDELSAAMRHFCVFDKIDCFLDRPHHHERWCATCHRRAPVKRGNPTVSIRRQENASADKAGIFSYDLTMSSRLATKRALMAKYTRHPICRAICSPVKLFDDERLYFI